MTRTTFISIAGEIYSKAKKRYYHRGQKQYLEFAEWVHLEHFTHKLERRWDHENKRSVYITPENKEKTIKELFEYWKVNVKNTKK